MEKKEFEHIEFIQDKKHIVTVTYDINYKKIRNDLINFLKIIRQHLKIYSVKIKIIWYKFLVIINKLIYKHNTFWENIKIGGK
jgi:hypothetical protein